MLFYHADNPDLMIPVIAKCMEHLKNKPDFTPGRTEALEDGVRCVISAYETIEESQAIWEAHRRYVDVHCVIQGKERVSVCSLVEAEVGTYYDERDYLEAKGVPTVDLCATAGTVLCLFPNDVHRTRVCSTPNQTSKILKVIFKVPLEWFEQ